MQTPHLLCDFLCNVGEKLLIAWVVAASKHCVLPDKNAVLIAKVVESLWLYVFIRGRRKGQLAGKRWFVWRTHCHEQRATYGSGAWL